MYKENGLVSEILKEFGITPNLLGYHYIQYAVELVRNNTDEKSRSTRILPSMTKVIYPGVAKEFYTTAERVERGIRHAIEKGWTKANTEMITTLFGTTAVYDEKVTNTEFIATIVEYVSRVESQTKPAQTDNEAILDAFISRLSKRLPVISPCVFRDVARNLLEEMNNGTGKE